MALAAEGRTVFVSSHLMSELEDTADHLIVIGRGRLLADVSVDELIATASGDRVEIKTPRRDGRDDRARECRRHRDLERPRPGRRPGDAGRRGWRSCSPRTGCRSRSSCRAGSTLEEAYFQLTRGAGEHTSVAIAAEESTRMTATLLLRVDEAPHPTGNARRAAAMCVLMVGMTAFLASQTETNAVFGGDDDVVQMGLAGVVFAEIAVVVAGASLITGEFATRDDPHDADRDPEPPARAPREGGRAQRRDLPAGADRVRGRVRARAVAAPRPRLRRACATRRSSITDPEAARAVVGTGLLLTAYALIALGIGTILRHSGATIAVGVGLLFLPVLFLGAFPEHIANAHRSSSRRSPAWRSSRRPTGC